MSWYMHLHLMYLFCERIQFFLLGKLCFSQNHRVKILKSLKILSNYSKSSVFRVNILNFNQIGFVKR
jgi:hypothetical protein